MTREILFRGKRLDNGEWVEGIVFPHDGAQCSILYQHPADGSLAGTEVDPATVGQFTGAMDKNGKKVFEGDVVRDKIRCENCRWFKENWCNEVMARPIKPTDFCSYFEPKESEATQSSVGVNIQKDLIRLEEEHRECSTCKHNDDSCENEYYYGCCGGFENNYKEKTE